MQNGFLKFAVALLVVLLGVPAVASAATQSVPPQNTSIPSFNPLCWHQKDCLEIRAQFLRKTVDELNPQEKNGWVQNQPECPGEEWGKCLPAGQSATEISFGGRSRFLHLGDFLQSMYKYAIAVAGILAIVVIVIAGFEWMMAGGNAESVGHAQSRIVGAVTGVIIAYLSYTLANTVDPALVNLRLPQVWMTRPQALTPQFCSEAPVGTLFALAAKENDQTTAIAPATNPVYNYKILPPSEQMSVQPPAPTGPTESVEPPNQSTPNQQTPQSTQPPAAPSAPAITDEKEFACGRRFFMQGGGTATCFGNYCEGSSQSCTNLNFSNGLAGKYHCEEGSIFGTVFANYVIPPACLIGGSGFDFPYAGEGMELYPFCRFPDGLVGIPDDAILSQKRVPVTVTVTNNELTKVQVFKIVIDDKTKVDDPKICGSYSDGTGIVGYAISMGLNVNCSIGGITTLVDRAGKQLPGVIGTYLHGTASVDKENNTTHFRQVDTGVLFSPNEILNGNIQLNLNVTEFKPDYTIKSF